MLKCVVFLLVLTHVTQCNEIELDNDGELELASDSYQTQEWTITAKLGYNVLIKIEHLLLAEQDLLLIHPAKSIEDSGVIFLNLLKKPRTFIIDSNSVHIKLKVNPPPYPDEKADDKNGFKLSCKRIGEEMITTTENPNTSTMLPTPGPYTNSSLTAYVFGKIDQDYKNADNLDELKSAIADMARTFIEDEDIKMKPGEEITTGNVIIFHLKRCPIQWPNSDKCIEILFDLPVVLEDQQDKYELVTSNLELMWSRYASKFLEPYNLSPYNTPNIENITVAWNLIISAIIAISAALSILYCFLILYRRKLITKTKLENDDDMNESDEKRYDSMHDYPEHLTTFSTFETNEGIIRTVRNRRYSETEFTTCTFVNPAYEDTETKFVGFAT